MSTLTIGEQLSLAFLLAALCRFFIQCLTPLVKAYVASKPWCPFVIENQKRMLYNFGFPSKPEPPLFPEGTTDELSLEMYSWCWLTIFLHAVSGVLMLPVFLLGWEGSGSIGQNAFLLGAIADVGFDIQDLVVVTLSTYFPETFGLARTPKMWHFLLMLHHPLAMSLTIPMNLRHLDHPSYHRIAFNLLFAAAASYGSGNYKMTLDVNKASDFLQFKAIVFSQLIIIIYTRVLVWIPEAYCLATHVYESNDMFLVSIGVPMSILMTIFNLALVNDAISSALKWLPRPMPVTAKEREEMAEEIVRSESPVPDVPNSVVEMLTPRSKERSLAQKVGMHFRNCNLCLVEDEQ